MDMIIKQRIASGALALALLGGTGASVAAQETDRTQRGGAAGLVAAVVQLDDVNVDVIEVSDSLNNLRALNNVLNNSPILNNLNIEVEDVIEVGDIDVELENVLSNNDIDIDDVIGVAVLSNGDLVVLS